MYSHLLWWTTTVALLVLPFLFRFHYFKLLIYLFFYFFIFFCIYFFSIDLIISIFLFCYSIHKYSVVCCNSTNYYQLLLLSLSLSILLLLSFTHFDYSWVVPPSSFSPVSPVLLVDNLVYLQDSIVTFLCFHFQTKLLTCLCLRSEINQLIRQGPLICPIRQILTEIRGPFFEKDWEIIA